MLPAQLPPNVWMGISTVNSGELRRDTYKLMMLDASVHWLSFEPALGPLDRHDLELLREYQWIVWGGESGPKARSIDLTTLVSLTNWWRAGALPPLFIKQFGELYAREHRLRQVHGADPSEWPVWARIQQFPQAA